MSLTRVAVPAFPFSQGRRREEKGGVPEKKPRAEARPLVERKFASAAGGVGIGSRYNGALRGNRHGQYPKSAKRGRPGERKGKL